MTFVDRVKSVLTSVEGITAWRINELKKTGEEVYFIKKTLDINRSKDVHKAAVTVYVAFEEEGTKYLGQSTSEVSPTMSDDEMRLIVEDAKTGASFVKNAYYELPSPVEGEPTKAVSNFSEGSLSGFMPKMAKAIYEKDTYEAGGINSAEIFLDQIERRIVTSKGIDVAFTTYNNLVEIITEWNDGKEPVESFYLRHFGDYMPDVLTEDAHQLIIDSKERAHGVDAPTVSGVPVILAGEAVKDFFSYYLTKSNARAIYEKISTYEVGQNVQGDEITGDLLNIELTPYLKGSSQSAGYDKDGVLLKPLTLVKDGVLANIYGENQFTSYLGTETTGSLSNMKVSVGSVSIDTIKEQPYVELQAFSAFQMSPITGEFGGELRLGQYFDGDKTVSFSGGAISELITNVQGAMKFSSEIAYIDNYVGPKYVILEGVTLTGK